MKKDGGDITALREAFRQGTLAHLCIDVQQAYCNPAHSFLKEAVKAYGKGGGKAVQANAELARKIRSFAKTNRGQMPNIWVLHDFAGEFHGKPYIADQDERRLHLRKHFFRVAPARDEAVVFKSEFDGFERTELKDTLEARRVSALVITGLYLHHCVSRTACSAIKNGYTPYVVQDLTSSGACTPHEIRRERKAMYEEGVRFVTRRQLAGILHV